MPFGFYHEHPAASVQPLLNAARQNPHRPIHPLRMAARAADPGSVGDEEGSEATLGRERTRARGAGRGLKAPPDSRHSHFATMALSTCREER